VSAPAHIYIRAHTCRVDVQGLAVFVGRSNAPPVLTKWGIEPASRGTAQPTACVHVRNYTCVRAQATTQTPS
jgi:hypothetical protein